VAWSPTAKLIGVCGYSGLVTAWKLTAEKPIFSQQIKAPGYCIAFTKDGKHLISGHDNGTIVVTPIRAK
jgi:hypothetical protein